MLEYKQVGQEVWLCDSVQCIAQPIVYGFLPGNDGRLYPVRLTESDIELLVEFASWENGFVSFDGYKDNTHFC
jgi:hypothetical protein